MMYSAWRCGLCRIQQLVDYLDLVEVLSSLKGHHVVGGDADDRFICGVLRSVESQRRLTRNHLHNKHTHHPKGSSGLLPVLNQDQNRPGVVFTDCWKINRVNQSFVGGTKEENIHWMTEKKQ